MRIAASDVSQFEVKGSKPINARMFNSKSDFNENLVKKDKIDFTSEVVEKVYEFLPSEQKYIIDEVGNIFELDPIGVVRTALEIMDYQLDPTWYAWGTKTPKIVDLKNIIYRGTQYEDILTKCENAGFELVTKEEEWLNLILHKGDKFPSQLKVKVKCKTEEAHVTEKMVALIGKYGCRYCNGRYKNQRITHAIVEDIFIDNTIVINEEVKVIYIFKEVGVDSKYQVYRKAMDVFRMKIDTFIELNIKDKNGKLIKLGIEAQGAQHYRTEKGFKSFLYLNKFKGQEFDQEWWSLRDEWDRSFQRDELKEVAFQNNNKHGYYLITVDNSLTASKRAGYILDELNRQAGMDIMYLSTNVKINEILSRIL